MTGSCLVTGAAGFIGRRLCKSLEANGEHVRALLREPCEGDWAKSVISELGTGVIPVVALKGVQTIFHLAGKAHALNETRQDEDEYFDINVEGTRKLLEAAKEADVQRFVFSAASKRWVRVGMNIWMNQLIVSLKPPMAGVSWRRSGL